MSYTRGSEEVKCISDIKQQIQFTLIVNTKLQNYKTN